MLNGTTAKVYSPASQTALQCSEGPDAEHNHLMFFYYYGFSISGEDDASLFRSPFDCHKRVTEERNSDSE
jgi:hypothetical protein